MLRRAQHDTNLKTRLPWLGRRRECNDNKRAQHLFREGRGEYPYLACLSARINQHFVRNFAELVLVEHPVPFLVKVAICSDKNGGGKAQHPVRLY